MCFIVLNHKDIMIKLRLNRKGLSIAELVVTIGLVGLMNYAVAHFIQVQNSELSKLKSNMDLLESSRDLNQAINQVGFCQYLVTDDSRADDRSGNTLNTSKLGSQSISFNQIPKTQDVGSPALIEVGKSLFNNNDLIVESIKLTNFKGLNDYYSADFQIEISSKRFKNQINKIKIKTFVNTDPTTSGAVKKITSCGKTPITDECERLGGILDSKGECSLFLGQVAWIKVKDGTSEPFTAQVYNGAQVKFKHYRSTSPYHSINSNPPPDMTEEVDAFIVRERINYENGSSVCSGKSTCGHAVSCNTSKGWYLSSCVIVGNGDDNDIASIPNGCSSNDFFQLKTSIMNVSCTKGLF